MPLTPPFVLVDRYDITAEIGRGGHAVVYRAHDRVLDREVAVKLLREDVMSSDTLARFRKEVQVTAQLEHAHILHVYDTGTFEGRPFIVMELASGSTLAARLEREHLLPITDALQIARDIGLALAYAHARGIVHRDVKPENILLSSSGAILADFGIARMTQEVLTQKITSTGTTVGTVQYMSPEQLCAEPDIDARSDQYSLACVLYEMLAGVRPHMAATFEALRVLRTTGRCEPVRTHRVSVPAAVDDAIARALAPVPADRFRGMGEFLGAMGVGVSGEFRAASDEWGAVRASGGYGAVSGSGGRSAASLDSEQRAAAASGVLGGALPLVTRLRSRRVIVSAIAASVVVAAGVFAAESRKESEESAGTLADGAVIVAIVGLNSRSADTTSLDARMRRALDSELDSWSGVRVVGTLPTKDTTAIELAPSVAAVGDSVRVRVELRRPGRAAVERIDTLVARAEAEGAPATVVASLVRRALVRQVSDALTTVETPGITAMPDRSLAVLRAYVGGFAALRTGKLDSAAASFRVAAQASAKPFAQAEFWAAQSGAWGEPKKPDAWKPNIDNAVRAGTLQGVDSMLAIALSSMSRGQFPAACGAYQEATQREPSSFVAWYGLGECQRLDTVVVKRPDGYRFRSSHWAALAAYKMAIKYAPSSEWLAALYPSMFRTTYAETNRARNGRGDDPGRTTYSAMPSLDSDTIALIPVPRIAFATKPPPTTWIPATRRGLVVALDFTRQWTAQWPESAPAWFQRALAFELAGRIRPGADGPSAQDALVNASRGRPSALVIAQIQVVRVRVALRLGDTEAAGRIARDAIAELSTSYPAVRVTLAPLAALVGDVQAAERLAVPDTERLANVPVDVEDSVAVFKVRAVMGACKKLRESAEALEAQFASRFTPQELPSRRQSLLQPAYRDAAPCIGTRAISEFPPVNDLDQVFRALHGGDRAGARRLLAAMRTSREGATIGSITWDHLFPETWATVQVGDSLVAREQLQRAIMDLSSISLFTLSQVAQAAGLRRGLELLAALTPANTNSAALRRLAMGHRELTRIGPSQR